MILLGWYLLASLCALLSASSPDPLTVTLPAGKLQGIFAESEIQKRKFAGFYGIPYAKPPVGHLRFKEPVASEPWNGTLMATEPPPMCPQRNFFGSERKAIGSEDCLYLNVFTPQVYDANLKLMDVVFIIHGGGFMILSGNQIGVKRFMDRNVVVVTINYRLGAFGFLSTEDLVSPGNYGLKDQNLALKWTRDNIIHFGGDPNRITITGCSAGGASVHFHLLSKSSKGFFHKAIPESGSALNFWALKDNPRKEAIKLASDLGCPTENTDELVKCLKGMPADAIALKQKFELFQLIPDFQFVPSVEPPHSGAFLDQHPLEVMAIGGGLDVPILASFAKDEGLLFLKNIIIDSNKLKETETNWNAIAVNLTSAYNKSDARKDEIAESLRNQYLGDKTFEQNKKGLVRMMSDYGFKVGIEESAKMMAKTNESPLYLYQFSYPRNINYVKFPLTDVDFEGDNHCEQALYLSYPAAGCKTDKEPMFRLMLDLTINFMEGKPLAKNWKPMKDELPNTSIFNISTSEWDMNELETVNDFSNVGLWKSLRS